jgi:preprotein translocase subunit SecB
MSDRKKDTKEKEKPQAQPAAVPQQPAAQAQTPAGQLPPATFQIEKVYVKDLSLEIPGAPQIFVEQLQPQLEVQIHTESARFSDVYYEVQVSATVSAKAGERTLFLAEAVQAGIFQLRNVPDAEIAPLLGIACANILFPYLRETISDLVTRGGFPPVLLSPISFEQLYLQQMQQAAQNSARAS